MSTDSTTFGRMTADEILSEDAEPVRWLEGYAVKVLRDHCCDLSSYITDTGCFGETSWLGTTYDAASILEWLGY